MAKRKYSSMKPKKIQPAVQTLTFATPSTSATRTYIDLSQAASVANRRFYRQGLNWAVAGFKVSSLKAGKVLIYKLPNTWVMSNAWEKGFRAWQKMNNNATDEAQSVKPKFLDYKIYADSRHHAAGFAANLLPIDSSGTPATAGEWESSKYIIPDTTSQSGQILNLEVVATGASYPGVGGSGLNAVSLIEGYAASRGLPNVLDPNTPSDAEDADGNSPENWMTAMFNDGTRQDAIVIDDMITENNLAPYPFENDGTNTDTMYPGGANQMSALEFHDFVNIFETNVTDGIGIQRLKGGNFPCGLICIDHTPNEAANLLIQIDLVPGHHRGYLAESMTEM